MTLFFFFVCERSKCMSIEQLKMIMCDVFSIDIYMPDTFSKNNFKKASYSLWAENEIIEYIEKRLYPQTKSSIEDIIDILREFISISHDFSLLNEFGGQMFSVACNVGIELEEILRAMK